MLILGKCWFRCPDHNNLIKRNKSHQDFVWNWKLKIREIPSKASVTASDSSDEESPSRSSSSLSLDTEKSFKKCLKIIFLIKYTYFFDIFQPVTVEAVEAVPKTEGFLAGTLEIDLDFSLSTLEGEPEILNML